MYLGPRSVCFRRFRSLCVKAFLAARKHHSQITMLVEVSVVWSIDQECVLC